MAKKKSKSSGVSEADSEVKPELQEEELEESESTEEQSGYDAGKKPFLGFMSNSEPEAEEESDSGSASEPSSDDGTERVLLESLWPSRLIVRNTPSGEEYIWEKAGSVVSVHPDDVEFLAAKNRKIRACCGSNGERNYFNL